MSYFIEDCYCISKAPDSFIILREFYNMSGIFYDNHPRKSAAFGYADGMDERKVSCHGVGLIQLLIQ